MGGVDIKPDLQFSVVCDDVRREDNGKFMLIGIFEAINAKEFPARHHSMCVASRWCKGEGSFTQKIRIVGSDNKTVVFQTEDQRFELGDIDTHHTIISRFNNLLFETPGKYWVEIFLNNELILNYPIMLKRMENKPV
jgi:hypothetical protein